MAQHIVSLVKPGNLSSFPRTQKVEGETQLHAAFLRHAHTIYTSSNDEALN